MARRYVLQILERNTIVENTQMNEMCFRELFMPDISLALHCFIEGAPPGLEGRS